MKPEDRKVWFLFLPSRFMSKQNLQSFPLSDEVAFAIDRFYFSVSISLPLSSRTIMLTGTPALLPGFQNRCFCESKQLNTNAEHVWFVHLLLEHLRMYD